METAPLSSPATPVRTTAQVHIEEDCLTGPSSQQTRAESFREFMDCVNSLSANYCKVQSWNAALEGKVQEQWTYGRDLYDKYTDGQRKLTQLKNALDARTICLAKADELIRRTREELSRCKDSWEQHSQTANATIERLESDRAICKDGAESLAETIDHKNREIERLRGHVEQLKAASVSQKGEHLQLVDQNMALQKELAEARDLLQALEALAEPPSRAARKKRKL